jgi:hypothetical protein
LSLLLGGDDLFKYRATDVQRDVPGPIVQLRTSVGSRATCRRLSHVTPGAVLVLAHTHSDACNSYHTVPLAYSPSSINCHLVT